MAVAAGTFEVDMTPAGPPDEASGVAVSRFALSKRFAGDLVGESVGEMLTATTAVDGSAGYVAIERVSGTMHARSGSFVLQHTGTMQAGNQSLSIAIVPDSGTDGFEGIAGHLDLRIEDGTHYYEIAYALPEH